MVDTACPPQVPTQDASQTVGVVSTYSVPLTWNPNPGPPRATADITAGTATKYRRALDDFDAFLAVRDCGSCSSLLALGLRFVVEAATKYLEWSFGSGELSSDAAGTLVAALRRLALLAVSLGASVPDSTPPFRAFRRLHEFLAPCSTARKLALAAAMFHFLHSGREGGGKSLGTTFTSSTGRKLPGGRTRSQNETPRGPR